LFLKAQVIAAVRLPETCTFGIRLWIEFLIEYTGPQDMSDQMEDLKPARRYRFGAFEADAATGELRRQGILIKLNAQPFQVLLMLVARPGQLLTREEICSELWPDGTFVDEEHGVNSAVNRIREALGDTAGNSRFVQTLARRGYRFVAPVERISSSENPPSSPAESLPMPDQPAADQAAVPATIPPTHETKLFARILASPEELPKASYPLVQTLFILMQFMYLGFYVGALANLAEIQDLLSPLPQATQAFTVLIVTAAILIPVRAFVLCAVLFHAPGVRRKFLGIWPFLLAFDVLWSLAPFLLLHHINFGLALACTTLLVYSPFAQRSLILMGAGADPQGSLR
jgi:DNA-binding winged helix-turn-helix (wHTH) protein